MSHDGVSGSGKSTLIFEVLAAAAGVFGLKHFDQMVTVE
jgi:excinuclease UvrABC ATPase subunit